MANGGIERLIAMTEATPSSEADYLFASPETELSSNRTALSFERTRMSADRTLMSVIRTSFSMIGFGFTLFEVFRQAAKSPTFGTMIGQHAPRNFGLSMIVIGIGLLVAGLIGHLQLMGRLGLRRERLHKIGVLRTGAEHSTTPTAVVAMLLLAIALLAVVGMTARAGPFG